MLDINISGSYNNRGEQECSTEKCPAALSADHLCKVHHDLNCGCNDGRGELYRPFFHCMEYIWKNSMSIRLIYRMWIT